MRLFDGEKGVGQFQPLHLVVDIAVELLVFIAGVPQEGRSLSVDGRQRQAVDQVIAVEKMRYSPETMICLQRRS